MKKRNRLSLVVLALILSGCATGENAVSYATVLGDITIVDNGGTNTTSKTNSADVDVAGNLANEKVSTANQKVASKIK